MSHVFLNGCDELGEGPVYDSRTNTLYWVDITGMRLNSVELSTGAFRSMGAPGRISSVGLTDDPGTLIASAELSLYLVYLGDGSFKAVGGVEERGTRFNDGKPDPFGGYVVGTMDLGERDPIGSLYRFDGSGFKRILSGLTISNGLAWDVEKRAFYHIDSPRKTVMAYRYDDEMSLSGPRVVADMREEPGVPDGMTIDSEGKLWVAHWGGWKVTRWDPESGKKLEEVRVQAKNVSCPAFGGAGLKTLFITSARGEGLGGSLFVADVGARGVEPFRFDLGRIRKGP